jgi:hypothetical protein
MLCVLFVRILWGSRVLQKQASCAILQYSTSAVLCLVTISCVSDDVQVNKGGSCSSRDSTSTKYHLYSETHTVPTELVQTKDGRSRSCWWVLGGA